MHYKSTAVHNIVYIYAFNYIQGHSNVWNHHTHVENGKGSER